MTEFRYLIFRPRPKKDGLHDAGYRFIALTGVDMEGNHHELGQWHDHLLIEVPCNIDVEPDGTIRIARKFGPRGFWLDDDRSWEDGKFWASTAWISDEGQLI